MGRCRCTQAHYFEMGVASRSNQESGTHPVIRVHTAYHSYPHPHMRSLRRFIRAGFEQVTELVRGYTQYFTTPHRISLPMKNHDEACAVPIKREAFRDPSKQGALLQSNDNDGNPNFTALDQQLYACVRGEAAQFGVGAHMYSREPAHIEARALEATAVAASIRAEIRRLVVASPIVRRTCE